MAQIQAGVTYATGGQVTATNLNAHVNNAVLVPGAISEQTAAVSVTSADTLLLLQSNALKKATVAQLPYINKDGSVAMTGELALSSSTPVNSLSAASKGYVDTKQSALGFTPVNKAGDTMTGLLVLSADPATALGAATKQYVDTKQSALGFTPVNKAGDTMTGALTLAADPASALQASTKQYVDTQVATRASASGGTLTGTYLFTGNLQTSTAPTQSNDVINKTYADSLLASIPKFAASAYISNSISNTSSTFNSSAFLTVLATRTAGSSTLTINYASLAARYYDPTKPFFLKEQYVGINSGITGITGRLYKIIASDLNAKTFSITTPETTAFSAAIQLSLVYDSTNLTLNQYGSNVKSIYVDLSASSKYYVNYIADIITGSSAPANPVNTPIRCVQVAGDSCNTQSPGYTYTNSIIVMRDVGITTNIYDKDVAEGFGSNSLGCHIGCFYSYNAGGYNPVVAGSFLISAILP